MQYSEIKKLPYCDLRMGVMFYFFGNPAEYKKDIKELFDEYCELTKDDFLYYYKDEHAGFKHIKKDYRQYFYDIIDKSDFETSKWIYMTNATKEQIQTVKVEMSLANTHPEYPGQIPNRMYFEFLPTIEFDEILHFIKHAFWGIPYQYCCGNFVIGSNDQYVHRSVSWAVKLFRETKCLSDVYSVFLNASLDFEYKNNKIGSPNFVQVFSQKLCNAVGLNKLIDTCEENDIYHELGEDYIMIALSKDKYPADDSEVLGKYIALNNLFKDIIFDMKKPRLYWKANEWDEWKKRFD